MTKNTFERLKELASRSTLSGDKLDNYLSDAAPMDAYDLGFDEGRTFLAMSIIKYERQFQDLFAFAEEFLIPVIRYTADKKAYINEQESEDYTAMGQEDYDKWAKSRAKLAIEKWDKISEDHEKAWPEYSDKN